MADRSAPSTGAPLNAGAAGRPPEGAAALAASNREPAAHGPARERPVARPQGEWQPGRLEQIAVLTQRLQQAGSRRDWQGIRQIDGEIAARAAAWAAAGDWSPAERMAIERLRSAHRRVAAQCDAEIAVLGQTLARINSQQGRWQAYSQSSNWGDSTP